MTYSFWRSSSRWRMTPAESMRAWSNTCRLPSNRWPLTKLLGWGMNPCLWRNWWIPATGTPFPVRKLPQKVSQTGLNSSVLPNSRTTRHTWSIWGWQTLLRRNEPSVQWLFHRTRSMCVWRGHRQHCQLLPRSPPGGLCLRVWIGGSQLLRKWPSLDSLCIRTSVFSFIYIYIEVYKSIGLQALLFDLAWCNTYRRYYIFYLYIYAPAPHRPPQWLSVSYI